jgi:hypothetical protein
VLSSKCLLFGTLLLTSLAASTAIAQNPPLTGDPYVPRGKPTSPNGEYDWRVDSNALIRYELISVQTGKALTSINAYYPEVNSSDLRYARAFGVFWNEDGTVVALDELNRRRAGNLYFFVLRGGLVSEIRSEKLIPLPVDADEGRLVIDPGWVSPTTIRVRQAVKTKKGEFSSKYFTIDFENPDAPKVSPAG